MNASLERIEPILCYAHAAIVSGNWDKAHQALRACADYAELHRAPATTEYSSYQSLESIVRGAARPLENLGGAGASLTGDAIQLTAIARAILRNAALNMDAELQVAAVECEGVPAWQFKIDGPGHFTDNLNFGFDLVLSAETIDAIWTSATRGGRIDRRANEIDFRLKGVRAILDAPTGCDAFVEALREAEYHARVLASGETVTNESELLRDALQKILRSFDEQDDQSKPFDLAALLRESFARSATDEPVRFETSTAEDIPPQSLRRNRMLRLFSTVQRMGRASLLHGGLLRTEMDYAISQRAVTIFINGEGKIDHERAEVYKPALERTVIAHDGSMEADVSDSGFTLLITLPDQIALALDQWLPGWDTFAPRSIQMLRLLKSGGPVPPEDLILNGVLEDELERRLLPRLGVAPAATLIHDLIPRKPDLAPSSPQRIEKVIAQLKRGKPKKEICAPVYAAEILYMFAIDQRHASSIGVENINTSHTAELAKTLSATPLNLLKALQLLPQVFSVHQK